MNLDPAWPRTDQPIIPLPNGPLLRLGSIVPTLSMQIVLEANGDPEYHPRVAVFPTRAIIIEEVSVLVVQKVL